MTRTNLNTGGEPRRLPLDSEVERERDIEVLCESPYGPYVRARSRPQLTNVHDDLIETFCRMDKKEVEKFALFIGMLSSFSLGEIDDVFKIVKIYQFFKWLYKGIKWLIVSFFAGLAVMATGGDQIEKIFGHIKSLISLWKVGKS